MLHRSVYCAGTSPALRYASEMLAERGVPVTRQRVEEAGYLLLDVPCFEKTLPEGLPRDIVLCGGNLSEFRSEGYRILDLLQDEIYLAQNAAITAHCAVGIAASLLPVTLAETPTLILGWGRIGKCLAQLLRGLGADVTVTARNPAHRAALLSLGYGTGEAEKLHLEPYRLIINTVPAPLLTPGQLAQCPRAVKLDLASRKGLCCPEAVWARGLPGIHAPESSGRLICDTLLRLLEEVEE